ARLLQMIGDRIWIPGAARHQAFGHPGVPAATAWWQHTIVQRLAGNGVNEPDTVTASLCRQQASLDRLLHDGQQRVFIEPGDVAPDGERNRLSNYRGNRQRPAYGFTQPGDPTFNDLAQQRRNDDAVEFVESPRIPGFTEQTFV